MVFLVNLIVAGGAGFIGSNFVRNAISGIYGNFSKITVLDKLTYAGNLANFSKNQFKEIEFIEGNITDIDLMNKLSKTNDVLINFAAESHVDRSILGSRVFVESNIMGVQTILDSIRNGKITTLIQVSTDEVYGSISTGSWSEDFPLMPNSPYAASKASGDLLCKAFHKTYGIDVRITRCSNNYGPYQYPEKIIPLFITNLIQGKNIPIYGNGLNVRDWLHVDDHCRAINMVLKKGKPGEIYNIGGGRELTNLDLTYKILELMKIDLNRIDFVGDRLGHDLRYSVNYNKISSELGYSPSINFEIGIIETINWFIENKSWWENLVKK